MIKEKGKRIKILKSIEILKLAKAGFYFCITATLLKNNF
jgi:hypothetical protein